MQGKIIMKYSFLFLLTLIFCGCSHSVDSKSINTELVYEAAQTMMSSNSFAGKVEASMWPTIINTLNAKSVRINEEGLYIVLKRGFVTEEGLFVPSKKPLKVEVGTDPDFTPIGNGVYTYHISG